MDDLVQLGSMLHDHNHELALSRQNVYDYFSLKTTTCVISKGQLVVRIQIPIRTIGYSYSLQALRRVPLAFGNSICLVNLASDYDCSDHDTSNSKVISISPHKFGI